VPGLRTLYLRTVGRKSGKPRRTRLYYIEDGANLAVVPSNGGRDNDPAWWLNLQAHADAEVEIGKTVRPIRARKAAPKDDARLWPQFVAGLRFYAAYRRRTTREIPVVILEPR
jgi:deazaflavin-dependent oxidoreductase (nitroreductase family)